MKKILAYSLCNFLTITNIIAGRDDYGRDYSVRDGDSSFTWIFIILAFIAYCAYNVFKKDEDDNSGRGCLASVIAFIIAFIIFAIIARALR